MIVPHPSPVKAAKGKTSVSIARVVTAGTPEQVRFGQGVVDRVYDPPCAMTKRPRVRLLVRNRS